ncbi:hypothetical protein ECABU_c11100 [Escherichia coli ABU 83972]|nr:hypothetical protein ECABU_c11100 [Escherichia coli ABU 83972]
MKLFILIHPIWASKKQMFYLYSSLLEGK